MITKFDVRPAPEFIGSDSKWIEKIIPIIISNIMELNCEMLKKELELKRVIAHGNKDVLHFFLPKEKIIFNEIPRIEKKVVSENITNKILIELIFEKDEVREEDKKDYFLELTTKKTANIRHEIFLENLVWKEING